MSRSALPLFVVFFFAAVARADATIPVEPGGLPLRCAYQDAPYWRDRESDAVKRAKKLVAAELAFEQAAGHHVLFRDHWHPSQRGGSAVVDLDENRATVMDDGAAAIVEDRGKLVGLVAFDRDGAKVRWLHPDGKLAWTARSDGRDDSASALVAGGQLIVASFHRIATGSSLRSYELATGRLLWTADVEQVNASHSKYFNDVTVELRGDRLILRGTEAQGCYVQVFEVATGKRLSSQMKR